MEARLEYVHIAYTFLNVWRRFACSVGDYEQIFLHRSSVGSLLRVRCWLGLPPAEPGALVIKLYMKEAFQCVD